MIDTGTLWYLSSPRRIRLRGDTGRGTSRLTCRPQPRSITCHAGTSWVVPTTAHSISRLGPSCSVRNWSVLTSRLLPSVSKFKFTAPSSFSTG
ncbi:hypothetical protein M8818_006991 [Zalaria obscura]|uniref:Uncharacterized protein n=1 Tax=Zalaria obscura TaxID=2024903 RepID=A0ACC3S3Q7_9PEZI